MLPAMHLLGDFAKFLRRRRALLGLLALAAANSAIGAPVLMISVDGMKLNEHLSFHEDLARELSRQDRVHTYAGFHICDVPA